MRIDLGRPGKAGVEATIKNGVLYIASSDHWRDWLHHIIPGARRREVIAAKQLIEAAADTMVHTVAGHSMGGCIATIVATMMGPVRLFVYAGKRAPRKYYTQPTRVYCHRGDFVPWIPFWRPAYRDTILFGKQLPFTEAHEPRAYRIMMERDGVV